MKDLLILILCLLAGLITLLRSRGTRAVRAANLLLREQGKNMPPSWAKRSCTARKNREPRLGKLLKAGELDAVNFLRDWELTYKKECFCRRLRALFELQRDATTSV
jgi:hypothetical protein